MRAVLLVCAGLFLGPGFAQGQTAQPATPIDRPPPDYPDAAGTSEGYVRLHFTIAKDGHVSDPSVIESSPPGLFDAAAIAGVKQWSYRPRLLGGHPVDQPDNAIIVRFKPPADAGPVWLNPEPPMYPRQAFDAKVEGRVKVGFDIASIGTADNIHVLETTAPGVFDAAAIEDVRQRVYQIAAGGPGIPGQTATIDYRLTDARVRPKPVRKVNPQYPNDAAQHGLNGYCAMDLTIAPDGSVSNAEIRTSFPRGVFDRACLSAMKLWTFETSAGLGVPVADHIKYMINFQMDDQNERDRHYLKPGQWIVLDYTLSVDGRPKDIKIAEQSQPDLPVGKAVAQLKNTKIAPFIENGVPVEKQHMRVRIE